MLQCESTRKEVIVKMGILDKPVLEVKDIQKFLNIGRRQAYELVESGQFHVVRVGKKYKIATEVFLEWLYGEQKYIV